MDIDEEETTIWDPSPSPEETWSDSEDIEWAHKGVVGEHINLFGENKCAIYSLSTVSHGLTKSTGMKCARVFRRFNASRAKEWNCRYAGWIGTEETAPPPPGKGRATTPTS